MYLKALELQGFKSFPEKTRINFEKNVTAIVGPNGSGKSNISDALLWVMGEQRTRTLRGGKMEDVIFGGTEKRSPMGFAQVSLVLDNSARLFDRDCDEITISRRYYRSGESEYYINKETVRLRDVTELLMDTGLGRDGYSIIGQGRIGEIVSAKSTDRREIFEEAAGISRFRHRKEESERKLEKTEENLLRIGDKISELELQVGPLKEQAETAKQYLLLRDELRLLEISLWMENLDRLRDQSEGLRRDFAEAERARDEARTALDAIYAAAENAAERMRENDLAIEHERERQRSAEAAAAESDSAAAVLRTQIANNTAAMERLRREMSEQDQRSDSLQQQINEHTERLERIAADRLQLSIDDAALRRQAEEKALGLQQRNQALSALLLQESELVSALSEKRSVMALLQESQESFEEHKAALAREKEELEQRLAGTENTVREAQRALQEAEAQVTRCQNMISGRQMLLSGRERAAAEEAERREKAAVELKGMEHRISILRELEKDLEGFNKAVKTIMREVERHTLRGVHAPVAKLIQVDERYALAVETALGSAAQNIVVDSQQAGKEAIELLKRRDGGRATFLPLDTIKPASLRDLPVNDPGFVDTCDALVKCEPKYKNIISNLLGRTVVAETLSDAIRMAKQSHNAYRIVTLDGQVLNAGGSMTGGSAGKGSGILSRANELERLSAGREKLSEELRRITAAAAEAERKLEQLRQELEGAREQSAVAREEQSRREGELNQARLLERAAHEALDELENRREELERSRHEGSDRIERLKQESETHERELAGLRERNAGENRAVDAVEQERRELEEALSDLRARFAALRSEEEAVTLASRQLQQLRADMQSESGQRRSALEAAEIHGAELAAELEECVQKLQRQRGEIEALQQEVAALAKQRMELEARRVSADKASQEKNRELVEHERICGRLEQRIQAADLEEKQILDKLWDNYELSRSAAEALRQPLESYSKTSRRVGELRRAISALGTPNLGAIDEYKRVSERYDFLTEQRDDVLRSKTEIESIIRDITSQMEEIFIEQFHRIDECFRTTFLEHFGGGKASLSLEDENDVLSCGIDIRIQPPGKALSNISLLSGGEKAFVAIALYFAIMKVRPTPFCVMDEIESALDEANVNLFADYLRRMSDKTQFIAITHRRGTMEGADQLYGVTMQEKGVSTVLGMDMQEALKNIH